MEELIKARKLIKSQLKNEYLTKSEKQKLESLSNEIKFFINTVYTRESNWA